MAVVGGLERGPSYAAAARAEIAWRLRRCKLNDAPWAPKARDGRLQSRAKPKCRLLKAPRVRTECSSVGRSSAVASRIIDRARKHSACDAECLLSLHRGQKETACMLVTKWWGRGGPGGARSAASSGSLRSRRAYRQCPGCGPSRSRALRLASDTCLDLNVLRGWRQGGALRSTLPGRWRGCCRLGGGEWGWESAAREERLPLGAAHPHATADAPSPRPVLVDGLAPPPRAPIRASLLPPRCVGDRPPCLPAPLTTASPCSVLGQM